MERAFSQVLLRWKKDPLRTPLIVRGARQVGKTYIIQAFGEGEFSHLVTINFEASPLYKACFETMDPVEIIRQLELLSKQPIRPEETLLFLDEIQQCPQALQALRYFKEKLPQLHVIAAGSLLEFSLKMENFSFPVGRVQFARLYPMSFEEFLLAKGEQTLVKTLPSFSWKTPPPAPIHLKLLELVKEYFQCGGMPAAVQTYIQTTSTLETLYVQRSLWESFAADFGKYASQAQHRHLRKIFEEVPRLVGDIVKYNRIDPELSNPAREIKHALESLKLAGLVHPIIATSGGSLPLQMGAKDHLFKLLFLDIGLVHQTMETVSSTPHLLNGPLAEQFVGQEIMAYTDPRLEEKLYFWMREKGDAEVDYLISHQNRVIPIEVKSGKTGKLKSLHVFLEEKKTPFGLKISQENLARHQRILSVPFYLIGHLHRLLDEAIELKSREIVNDYSSL